MNPVTGTPAVVRPVLVVDDNLADLELLRWAFAEAGVGHAFEAARGGQAGLDYMFGHAAFADRTTHPLPALVLLDINMPAVDGFEFLQHVKTEPNLRRIPVLVLTSSSDERDRARAYDLGANGYLSKPLTLDGLVALVQRTTDYWLGLNVTPPLA